MIVTAGVFATQQQLEADPALLERLLVVDFAQHGPLLRRGPEALLARGGGTLCVFSSVAGERGRKPVVLYGAAKAGLSRATSRPWTTSYRSEGLRVVCVKPGFVRTGMTAGLPEPPFAGDPDAVARVVIRALDRGTPVVYAPPIWRWSCSWFGCFPEPS